MKKTHSIELREAINPWGPWSKPFKLVSAINYPGLYGAYMHPVYTEDNVRIFYLTMTQWGPYNVFLMRELK